MPYGRGAYGVSHSEVSSFVESSPLVTGWIRKFASSPAGGLSGSRLNKARILCRFFKWLRVKKGLDLSPSALLDRQLKLRESVSVGDRQWLLSLVLEHSRDNEDFEGFADARKYDVFSTVKNFCDYHEVGLTNARGVFGKKRKRKNRRSQISLAEAKELLGQMNQRDRTIHLIQLQSGMEIGAVLEKFNYMWHSQVKAQMGRERIKVEFDERKANGTPYFTFISRDAIHELRKWLIERKRIVDALLSGGKKLPASLVEGEPIFITSRGQPLRENYFLSSFTKKMKGKVTSHMFRILFESEAKVPSRAIDKDMIKFWMGHITDLDDAGGIYDRNPEIRPEVVEKEYAKLEPFINIYSGEAGVESSEEVEALRREVARLQSEQKVMEPIVKNLPLLLRLAEEYKRKLERQ